MLTARSLCQGSASPSRGWMAASQEHEMGEEEDGRVDERTSLSRLDFVANGRGGKNPQEMQESVDVGNALFWRH